MNILINELEDFFSAILTSFRPIIELLY